MQSEVMDLRRVADDIQVPDGHYSGAWGGYVVRFVCDGVKYEGRTKVDIRTPRALCTVTVRDGSATVAVNYGGV